MKSHQSTTLNVWKNICSANEKIISCNPWKETEDEENCKNINCILCCTPFVAMVGVKAIGVVIVSAAGVIATPFALCVDAVSCCKGTNDQDMDNESGAASVYQKL